MAILSTHRRLCGDLIPLLGPTGYIGLHHSPGGTSKTGAEEAVEDRVEGTISMAQPEGEGQRGQPHGPHGVGRQEVQVETEQVVGHPAAGEQDGEHDQHARHLASARHDPLHGLLAHGRVHPVQMAALRPQPAPQARVARRDETAGQHEHTAEQEDIVGLSPAALGPHLVAEVQLLPRYHLDHVHPPHEEQGHHDGERQQPDGEGELGSVSCGGEGAEGHRVANGQVSVNAQQHDGEDARRDGHT